MDKKFEILNYDELPKKNLSKNKVIISWNEIRQGFIFKTTHIKYGYNEFEFIRKEHDDILFLRYNGEIFKTLTYTFTKGNIGKIIGSVTKDFKIKIGENIKDKNRNIIIVDKEYRKQKQKPDKQGRIYFKNEKWYKYTCNVCSWTEGWIPENNLLRGVGCSCCANKTAVLGINTIWDTHKLLVDDFGLDEEFAKTNTHGIQRKGNFLCRDCGTIKKCSIVDVVRRKSIGCNCGDGFSYPSKIIHNILTQLNVKFQIEYSPNYLKREEYGRRSQKRSDFYIPSLNLVIEADGGLGHKGGVVHGKSKKTLEECIEIDRWKDEQHKLHGVETIRIDCCKSELEYIKNSILNSKLSDIFDLSNINWIQADLYAIKNNKAKEIWDYWNNRGETETTEDLIKLFGLSRSTILRYLKKGHDLNLCVYNKEEERRRSGEKIKSSLGRRVEVFKYGISLGVFNSLTEVERVSLRLFKTQLNHSSISATIKNKQRTHKGFTFKYVENN